jgi:hypothetical protein
MVVVQKFAATDVCHANFLAGCRCRAASNFVPGLQSAGDTREVCCRAVPGERSVVGAAAPGDGGAVPEAVVMVFGAGGMVPGTGAMVPLSAESFHPLRQLINASHQLGVVANASECRPGDGLGNTVHIVGCSDQRNLGMTYESGLDVVR